MDLRQELESENKDLEENQNNKDDMGDTDDQKEQEVNKVNEVNDEELEKETDLIVDQIKNKAVTQEDTKVKPSLDSILVKAIAGIAAITFCVLVFNSFTNDSVSNAKFAKGVNYIVKKNHNEIITVEQNLKDKISAQADSFNSKLRQVDNDINQLNKNMAKLNDNIEQVQTNILSQIKASKSPDLSSLQQTVTSLKQLSKKLADKNHSTARVSTNSTTENRINKVSNADIDYIGLSPNGAVLKITKGNNESYITVNAGENTKLGKVSYLNDNVIVINNKTFKRI